MWQGNRKSLGVELKLFESDAHDLPLAQSRHSLRISMTGA
ncbi:hypothetical protein JCM19233_6989 [Vibrio astriarenae]|nr:hypothetical protein JCM19233_6989 [Vibrio sp. C7]